MRFLCFLVCIFSQLAASEKPFVIVIPSYNNQQWCVANLSSVLSQDYTNYRIIYIDDSSSDGTKALADAFAVNYPRVTVIHNTQRVGALCNTYRAVSMCKPEEIVAILDGDDWFANTQVLKKLNEVYADPDVWMTYGQFQYYPSGYPGWARAVPDSIIEKNDVRNYDWVTTHLKTFYASLFHKIKVEDLFFNSWFYTMAGDLAYTLPICEMAGRHARFIPDVLYIYNVASPLNDHKVNLDLQIYYTYVIRGKQKYQALEAL
ncbi:MAG: hypothetical protein RLZZ453_555 [Chlamydiota bacterium]|jgi:glycosyltransferase involved in cell wall biosynthesis